MTYRQTLDRVGMESGQDGMQDAMQYLINPMDAAQISDGIDGSSHGTSSTLTTMYKHSHVMDRQSSSNSWYQQ
jgi:hypothetical protein